MISLKRIGVLFLLCAGYCVNQSNASPFDISECSKTKTCFMPDNCAIDQCNVAASLRVVEDASSGAFYMDVELIGKQSSDSGVYLALGLSTDDRMGNDFVSECSSLGTEKLSAKVSYNDNSPRNVRIAGLTDSQFSQIFSNFTSQFADGQLYCKFTQKVTQVSVQNPRIFEYTADVKKYLLVAKGTTGTAGLNGHADADASVSGQAVTLSKVGSIGTDHTKKRLIKAHAILMVLSWFCFIPTAIFFARFMRDAWPDYKPGGLLIWFHVHRTFNLLGILLFLSSLICILTAMKWTWTGPGSKNPRWIELHTSFGLSALFMGVIQPFISTMRCDTRNPRRQYFNWIHRLIGTAAIILATTTFGFASWNALEIISGTFYIIIEVLPFSCLVLLSVFFVVIERVVEVTPHNLRQQRRLRYLAVFAAEALLISISISFCIFIGLR